ncbi:bifunctional ornithine acetyltransferase/N-acetylglutamate synthase [uncultured Clostridium sp.]|jgi:glutamate N-acetyltransferase/amino-acid N-acetyltransferase|uniref:bifunctional ornithine acetyltransferase/N-acetylglutamate synthase n=1 Tax=uncultured Clostridium sp. TaxID=59620 RepID=UPI0026118A53|nr:bifunctional ornithine acetyltransferase/N-acetylglutamate synthase [uncultured Clostridium sp.]
MKVLRGGITEAKGFLASGIHCGIKKRKEKLDLALIYSEIPAVAAGVYTQNIVKGNPIEVCKKHLENGIAQAVIINSGNANTCSGIDGLEKAYKMASLIAEECKIGMEDVLVASTGVIGVPLNIQAIEDNVAKLVSCLNKKGNIYAREAIMTTDLIKKEVAVSFNIGDEVVTIGGIAKGSGMINPNMATTLAFVTTDININKVCLEKALKIATEKSFNRVSVDGDQSTNDSILILANGKAENELISIEGEIYNEFLEALTFVLMELAKLVAKDGEGATKLIECRVNNTRTEDEAVILAKSVIQSDLVKTAIFGNDANWGRILCALGYSGVIFDLNKIEIAFESSKGYLELFKNGNPIGFSEEKAKEILEESEINILVNINSGNYSGYAFGCDLSYEYVRINGDYRT